MSQEPPRVHPDKHRITKGIPKDYREIVDSAIDHVGMMLDNTSIKDLADIAPYLAVAYLGYGFKNDTKDAALCVLGLRLATVNGTPPLSQAAGLALLATYAVIAPGSWITETPIGQTIINIRLNAEGGLLDYYDKKTKDVDPNILPDVKVLNAIVATANMDILQAVNTNDRELYQAAMTRKIEALKKLSALGIDVSIYGAVT